MITRREALRLGAAGFFAAQVAACRRGNDITVGSKNFQEQWILAAAIAEQIRRATQRSAATKDLSGTFLCHTAIMSGAIDCYVEYTGTAYSAILGREPIADAGAVYRGVKAHYGENLGLLWLPPLGFENTFAILVRRPDAVRYQLRTISDLRRVAHKFRPGFGFEFYERADGYRGLTERYGLAFAIAPKEMKLGLTYRALASGEVDVIAGNSTDGLIAHLDLVILADDRAYFPPYEAAVVMRRQTAMRYPSVAAAVRRLSGRITAAEMRRANYAVDGQHRSPEEVAHELLSRVGLAREPRGQGPR